MIPLLKDVQIWPERNWIKLISQRLPSRFDFVFVSQIPLLGGNSDFQVDWLDAKFHHGELGKRLLFFRERLSRKAFIF